MILFDVGDELKIVSMLTKAVKGLSVKVLKLSLMALRPCYQLVYWFIGLFGNHFSRLTALRIS